MQKPYFFKLEENKTVVRKLLEAVNSRNLDLLEEFISEDNVDRTHNLRGLEEIKKFLTMLFKGLDFHATLEDITAEGDKVWARFTFNGTHIGDFRGIIPTGEKFMEPAVQIFRVVNGKVSEVLQVSDELDLSLRLGLVEYTDKAKKLVPGK